MRHLNRFVFVIVLSSLLTACNAGDAPGEAVADVALDVYKSESCGCCGIWTNYMEKHGFAIRIHHPDDLNAIKEQYDIAPQWQSCHTAVTEGGRFFEGHIPARYVKAFLDNPPADALGLAVPGMPLGSPGMEVENRFTPYEIVALLKDGGTRVYATINQASDQY